MNCKNMQQELINSSGQDQEPSEAEKLDWLRLSRAENVGPITFYRLLEAYGSPAKALEALPDLSRRGGRKKPLTAPPMDVIEREYEALQRLGGQIITTACKAYPMALTSCDDAPPVLSALGDIKRLNQSCLAMVGARSASLNGRKFAQKLSSELGKNGQIIVSGLARGIDTAAHRGALETGTIAVVASGLDVIYPPENEGLYEDIKERGGLIIAESPLGQQPFAAAFPRRNRIVSGLSKGVVVIEATMRSGSLITARLSSEQGRDVYAVPGHPLDARAQGPNHLIREGATLVRNANDILEILNLYTDQTLRESLYTQMPFDIGDLDPDDIPANISDIIASQLSFEPVSVDELLRACQLSIPVMQTALLELELAGRLKRYSGNRVSLLQE